MRTEPKSFGEQLDLGWVSGPYECCGLGAQACAFFTIHMLGATACFASAALYALLQCALTQRVRARVRRGSLDAHTHFLSANANGNGNVDVPPPFAFPNAAVDMRRAPAAAMINGTPRAAQYNAYGATSASPLQLAAASFREQPVAAAGLERHTPSASASTAPSDAHRDALWSLHASRTANLVHAVRWLLVVLLILLPLVGAVTNC